MTAFIFLLVFLAVTVFALWHNHSTSRYAGSVDAEDREQADLWAMAARWRH
ncbi:MAG TPA: hypothetical protein VJX66_10895 [Amycolatopsis sp.]|nr:hypothetical protein [Amycolatopsis sp.]